MPLPDGDGHIANIPSLCAFHNVTGIPCPGCGLTRSFVSCGHGHLTQAFIYHPAGPLLFAALIIYLALALRPLNLDRFRPYYFRFGIAAAAVLVSTWSVRLLGYFPWP